MSSHTFPIYLQNGTLVIPPAAIEYLNQCQGDVEVSLTIQSTASTTTFPVLVNDNSNSDFQPLWDRWFSEVERIEPPSSPSAPAQYGEALLEKYRKQGLEL